jgi:hypothetical protein
MFISARSQRVKETTPTRIPFARIRPSAGFGLFNSIGLFEINAIQPSTIWVTLILIAILTLHWRVEPGLQGLLLIAESAAAGLSGLLLYFRYNRAVGQVDTAERTRAAAVAELQTLRQTIRWQHEITALATCMSRDELDRRATSLSMAIAGHHAQQAWSSDDRSPAQTDALIFLSDVVNLRIQALESVQWRDQQRGALASLWQIASLLRVPGSARQQLVHAPCAQLANALNLDWLVLLAPGEFTPIAPVLTAYGRTTQRLTLGQAQLRIAAEALQTERPLIRNEGNTTLACLPILRIGHAPMVIVARGAAGEEATQSILLLLGDLLARHFENLSEREVGRA